MFGRKKKEREEAESGDRAGFGEEQPPGGRSRLTPEDVQKKEFRLAFRRGYREDEVDQFLDDVTEDLASLHQENKRLRERVQERGGAPSGDVLRDAERRSAEIVRQAREYAARLIEDSENREARPATPAPASFLIRERDFLQRMAALIQEHAEALKREARMGAAAPSAEGPTPTEASAPPVPPSPVVAESGDAASMPPPAPGQEPWMEEPTRSHDPLLEEWEGSLAGEPRSQPTDEGRAEEEFFTEPPREPRRDREEQSLRDLFWGEE